MLNVFDLRAALLHKMLSVGDPPVHLAAFMAWVTNDREKLKATLEKALDFTGQARHPEHVAVQSDGRVDAAQQFADPTLLAHP